jgi:hypothetical protein
MICSIEPKIVMVNIESMFMEQMASASWEKNGYAYLLIGGQDTLLINDMAKEFAYTF